MALSEAAVQSPVVLRTEGSLRREIVKARPKPASDKATTVKLATGLCTAASLLVGLIR
jgi:hypothetical protein